MKNSSMTAPIQSLVGAAVPDLRLQSTAGGEVSLNTLSGWTVLFFYPRTGNPNEPAPSGLADISGTKGCTPQACEFRNNHGSFLNLGVENLYGVSSQSTDYQLELATRLCLTYPILSDPTCDVGHALGMRLIELSGSWFYARTTLVIKNGVIVKVFDDIADPESNARDVANWIKAQRANPA
ncbi:peroxiredoxin [Pseudomonas syringae]|uniref:Peroxiredoxin n=1 Tax=Pseudomonas syringae pv. actinidiae TaxID=103796 RepID=A0A2V0QF20_PSESF|nr:peroxiredoxin [Pseudomonas syringae]BBI43245.1 putative peroxiredoxin bcp [Pseudomonas syringae pv. actinidiae]GBH11551.1 Peroxiredoxin [Pseudomonas syringae pv. actinidiae]